METAKSIWQSKHKKDILFFFILTFLLLLVTVQRMKAWPLVQAAPSSDAPERQTISLPPLSGDGTLFFALVDALSLKAAPVDQTDRTANALGAVSLAEEMVNWGYERETQPSVAEDTEFGHEGGPLIAGTYTSPNGRLVAVQLYLGVTPEIWILDTANRAEPKMTRLTAEGYGVFMGWHPDSQHVLASIQDLEVSDPGLWVVDVTDGSHQRIEIPGLVAPQGLTAAAFSPNGTTIAYATTKGMGFGSEIWLGDGKDIAQMVWKNEYTVVGSLSWSPDGSRIAFSTLLDSPVPFAAAGVWVMKGDGTEATCLSAMDGGHGQSPVWSHDSQKLYFVARDNLDDTNADYRAEALISSIRSLDLNTGETEVVVPADGARQLDLSLTQDGNVLFVSNRGGGETLEVWNASLDGGIQQVTTDGEAKRHPVFVVASSQ